MLLNPVPLPKHQRITLLIQKLQTTAHVCGNAQEAHRHIRKCLEEIEERYGPLSKKMCMNQLHDFKLRQELGIYFHVTAKHDHIIFIHKNGAYAIHKYEASASSNHFDLSFHKGQATCLVKFDNKYNQSLW